jgi:hypothetical protein
MSTSISRTCVKAGQIILLQEKPDRCVIEIDVEPTFAACRNEVFFIQREGGEKKFYIREDIGSRIVKPDQLKNFTRVVAANSKIRQNEEDKFAQGGSPNINPRLNHLVCRRNAKLQDKEYQV